MDNQPIYIFLPEIMQDGDYHSGGAYLIYPYFAEDVRVESFPATLINANEKVTIRCRMGVSEFSSAQDEFGTPVTLFDGFSNSYNSELEIYSCAQNSILLRLEGNFRGISAPALVSNEANAIFTSYSCIVEIFCSTLADLPDFKANIAELREFTLKTQAASMPSQPEFLSEELMLLGQKVSVGSKLVLPISCGGNSHPSFGAIILEDQLSKSPFLFEAKIYMFDANCPLSSGLMLYRRVDYSKISQDQRLELCIGRVHSFRQ